MASVSNYIGVSILGLAAVTAYFLFRKGGAGANATGLAGGLSAVGTQIGTGLSDLVSPSTWNTLFAPANDLSLTVAGTDTNVADANGQNGQTADSAAHSAAIIAGTAPYSPYVPPTSQPAGTLTGGYSGAVQ